MSDKQLAIMMSPTILSRLVMLRHRLRPTANWLSLASEPDGPRLKEI